MKMQVSRGWSAIFVIGKIVLLRRGRDRTVSGVSKKN